MPALFTPYTLKGVTLRNRIGMSPMTMYRSEDGKMNDYHLMYLGARAAGGFGLIFPEQVAISPEGRTSVHCAGIYEDEQIESHARVTKMIREMGAVGGIQLGHTGRNGSELKPWEGWTQIAPDDPKGWQVVGPSDVPYGCGKRPFPVHALTVDEIKALHRKYADAARRSADAGYQWLEMHFAHGYLAASFLSPLANKRTDQYGGSLENRARFLLEALDAVREVWPEEYPLTMRLGCDDFHPDGTQFEDSIVAIGWMKERGLDLADISMGGNTDEMTEPLFAPPSAWVQRAARIKREIGIDMAASWNLGVPSNADAAVRSGALDVVLLGRPALANPHWPVWAARELGHPDPFSLVPQDWGWWLTNFRGHDPSIGWPEILVEEEIVASGQPMPSQREMTGV
jgi:2,4-dienoyl-CoA reductase-like NADH-dependent reductase (Old Yellow Enzyme family)